MAAIQLMATNALGQRVVLNPFALRDDDNDNHLDACFGPEVAELTLIRVAVDSHDFFGPQNAPNRAAAVPIDDDDNDDDDNDDDNDDDDD